MGTLFAAVYNRFLGKITDDMYMEITPQETIWDLQSMLISALPGFEFPRKKLDYECLTRTITEGSVNVQGFVVKNKDGEAVEDASYFYSDLSSEEVNILALLMLESWVQRQVSSIEVTRMKYSGSDFKMTSQAAHLNKLLSLLEEAQRQSHHMQRLYKRRKTDKEGNIKSNWSMLREYTVIGNNEKSEEDESGTTTIILEGGTI